MSKINLSQIHVIFELKSGKEVGYIVDTLLQDGDEYTLYFGTYTRYPGAVKTIDISKVAAITVLPYLTENFETESILMTEEEFEKWRKLTPNQ